MKALVTGATGFVGYALAKLLVAEDFRVRIMARGQVPEHVKALDVELCTGDLGDKDSLKAAVADCDYLFHVAAHYSLWAPDPQIYYRINVDGSKNLLTVAHDNGVKKIVYTSSVAAIKPASDESAVNEEQTTRLADVVGHYKRSKYLAEQAVSELAAQGVPVTIVNPSAPVGPFDIKPTPTGKIIVDYLQGKMFGYLHTGLNLVAVEDVARGHLLALEKGAHGRRYILGNQNLYLIEIFRMLEKISGVKAPTFKVPYFLAYATGIASESWGKIRNRPPEIPVDGVRMARKCMFFDNSRAKSELGFLPTSVEEALGRAVTWFQKHNYI